MGLGVQYSLNSKNSILNFHGPKLGLKYYFWNKEWYSMVILRNLMGMLGNLDPLQHRGWQ